MADPQPLEGLRRLVVHARHQLAATTQPVQNTHGVTHSGPNVRILNPPRGRLTGDEAKAYAAWLVLSAERVDPGGVPFEQVLDAVRMTNLTGGVQHG